MTMTVGTGPFGHRPAGRFNFEMPMEGIQYLEAFPRRIRGFARGEVVVDSIDVQMLYEQHRLPVWCFPPEDVRLDELGDAAWIYENGLAKGLIGIRWDAVDRWLEEDEEVIVHPRDPMVDDRLAQRDLRRRAWHEASRLGAAPRNLTSVRSAGGQRVEVSGRFVPADQANRDATCRRSTIPQLAIAVHPLLSAACKLTANGRAGNSSAR
jgi:hypothetical protein